ncbi:MAG TPA: MFS transporter [Gaiellaceae bacterium]
MESQAAAAPSTVWAPEWRGLTVGLVVTVTLVASEALAVATILPLVARDLDGLSLYGWVISAFFLGTLVGLVIGGEEVDRRGPATPFAVSLAFFAAGLVTAGLAPAMWVVVTGRVLQGLGAGALPAISYAAIGRTIPDALRPRVFAILSTAWVIPGIAGPGAAAAVAAAFGWRAVFLGLLPFVVAAGTVAYRALRPIGPPDQPSEAAHRIVPALGLAAAAALALAALQQRSLVSFVLLPASFLVGWRPARTLFPPGTLRAAPGLPATVLVRGLLIFGFFGADTFVPLMLVQVRGESTALAGAALTSATLAWTTAAWVQARYVLRLGARMFVRTGLVVVVVGVAATAVTLLPEVPPATAVATWGVAGFGIGLAYSVLSLTTLREASPGQEGTASASLNLAENLGVAFGAGIGGAAVAAAAAHGRIAAGIAVAFAIAATVALVGVVAAANVPAASPQ